LLKEQQVKLIWILNLNTCTCTNFHVCFINTYLNYII
jgi:hypothetical protein